MTISVAAFSVLVTVALAITAGAPVLLLALLVRDWKRKRLW
jgi:hypothetical protein